MALLLSPRAGLPQRLLPSTSIANDEPAEKLQSGVTSKVSLNLRLLALTGSLIEPGKLPLGNTWLRS